MNLHDLQTTVRVSKDKKNDFGGYNYRTAEGILAAIKAALSPGDTITLTDELQELAGQIFVSSEAVLTLGGEVHRARGHAMHPLSKKGMDPSQITGTASSYARKYALSGIMALDDGSVDPDAAREPYDPFNAETERDRIKHGITGARTLPGLKKTWLDSIREINLIKAASQEMFDELSSAKDKRKLELTPPDPAMQSPHDNADLGGDEIPYEGKAA